MRRLLIAALWLGIVATPASARTGGKLTVLWTGDVDHIDCGQTYYELGTFICNATQKALYGFQPGDGRTPVPDLAAGAPQVSADGRTVTVPIKAGVRYSPPYQAHTVTSADVKYAIEREFFRSVDGGFALTYFSDLAGARNHAKAGRRISGITTPDAQTVVLHFRHAVAGMIVSGALAFGATAPVPRAYAAKYDRRSRSTYGAHQLATGPYMVKRYRRGKEIQLVRNPSWDRSLDFKPAYLDEIDNVEGNDDLVVASRRILSGQSMINGDFSPPTASLRDALSQRATQVVFTGGASTRWIALNTKVKPFNDLNVRKAVLAGMDRNALVGTRGGALAGDVATHFLPPGMAGFDQAGGTAGPGVDFLSPDGSPRPDVAANYFRAAGFASGKYEGKRPLVMVGVNRGVSASTAKVAATQLRKLGFRIRLRLVESATMYTRYCDTPSAKIAICPNVGWVRDFADGQAMLDPTFNGKNIYAQGNTNWSQLDVPALNRAIDAAELLPADQRPAAWANVDRMIVDQAPAVPWIWDKTALIESANVNGVASQSNTLWELSFMSLK